MRLCCLLNLPCLLNTTACRPHQAAAAGGRPWPAGSRAHWPASLAAPDEPAAPYLQVALDLCNVAGAMKLLDATVAAGEALPELLEVGTPVVIDEGLTAVRKLKARYPVRSSAAAV